MLLWPSSKNVAKNAQPWVSWLMLPSFVAPLLKELLWFSFHQIKTEYFTVRLSLRKKNKEQFPDEKDNKFDTHWAWKWIDDDMIFEWGETFSTLWGCWKPQLWSRLRESNLYCCFLINHGAIICGRPSASHYFRTEPSAFLSLQEGSGGYLQTKKLMEKEGGCDWSSWNMVSLCWNHTDKGQNS